MKLNKKEEVLEFITAYSSDFKHDEYPKLTTTFLSEKLNMQRTNLSSLLNQLVKEGKLLKHNGRPVLYQLSDQTGDGDEIFRKLIGWDGSLKEAVAVAKAAILYPEGKGSILLSAEKGGGARYFTRVLFQFATLSGIVKTSGTLQIFNCRNYEENEEYGRNVLYGTDKQMGLLGKSKDGILFLKNADLLPGYERRQILSYQERGMVLLGVTSGSGEEKLKDSADFSIQIPPIREWTLKERLRLIQKFFMEEAKNLKRNLEVDPAIFYGLLLYDVIGNVAGLKNDIHKGCANCYARTRQGRNRFVEVLLSDFSSEIRKGVIYYKVHKEEIDGMISGDYKYAFTDSNVLKKRKVDKEEKPTDIYQSLDQRKRKLKEQRVTEEEINYLISAGLEQDFSEYYEGLLEKMKGNRELSNYVSGKLIRLVEHFLREAEKSLGEKYGEDILGPVCLHVNASLIRVMKKQRISNEEIQHLMESYPKEYALSRDFVKTVEQEFRITMNIDEIVYIMLFLLRKRVRQESKVAVLIAMHGTGGASSVAHAANFMTKEKGVFSFDLPLELNMREAYEELKQTITRIHQGKGILMIYDMGSIRTMAESIGEETGIEMRFLEVPVTLLAIGASNRAQDNESLEDIYAYLQTHFRNNQYVREQRNDSMSLSDIFGENPRDKEETSGMEEAFDYLREQFAYMDMEKMEAILRKFFHEAEYLFDMTLDEDKEIALVIHLVCLTDRILHNYTPSINFIASDIIQENKELVLEVKKILEPLEREFHVYIGDGEIATIISIIRN